MLPSSVGSWYEYGYNGYAIPHSNTVEAREGMPASDHCVSDASCDKGGRRAETRACGLSTPDTANSAGVMRQ